MSRIPSTLRVLHFLVLALVFAGASCRDDGDLYRGLAGDPDWGEADDSPIAGTIQGSFAVSPTGDATYTIPLTVPPGAAGMQPALAITYDSASGNGLLGMGFSLSGLSSISRCPRTVAHDGRIRAVRDDAQDALCLDGARLVEVGKSSGLTEYRTFPDTFTKVLASPGDLPANPAQSFQVFTQSGRILEYGGTTESAVMGRNGAIRAWLLRQARDRSGNTIDYEYSNVTAGDGHTTESLPLLIRYTGNKGVAPRHTILFSYETRVYQDRRTHYVEGTAVDRTKQLRAIFMLGPGDVTEREYRFAYRDGRPSGRTILRNIKECAGDGSCKPRTSFAWHLESSDFEQIETNIPAPQSRLSGWRSTVDTEGSSAVSRVGSRCASRDAAP